MKVSALRAPLLIGLAAVAAVPSTAWAQSPSALTPAPVDPETPAAPPASPPGTSPMIAPSAAPAEPPAPAWTTPPSSSSESPAPPIAKPRLMDDNDGHAGFGIVPGARIGKTWGDYPVAADKTQSSAGIVGELHLDAIFVLPGDHFALAGSFGWMSQNLSAPDGTKGVDPSFSYSGWTVSPVLMAGVGRFFLSVNYGLVLGTVSQDGTEQDVTGSRFGARLTAVVFRNPGADLGLSVGLQRTDSGNFTYEGAKTSSQFAATSFELGFTCAFLPNFLGL